MRKGILKELLIERTCVGYLFNRGDMGETRKYQEKN